MSGAERGCALAPQAVRDSLARSRRLLLVRLDNIGDVLMCTPAMRALREARPDAHLTLLGSPSAAALAGHLPLVDAVVTHSSSWVRLRDDSEPGGDLQLIAALAAGQYDAAVIFTSATQSALPAALACRAAGIPLRLAYARENPYALLSWWARETDLVGPGMRHEVQRQLDLLGAAGIAAPSCSRLEFALCDGDRLAARQALARAGLASGRPYVLFHPGATAPSRRYPPAALGEVIGMVSAAGWACVLCGGPDDLDLMRAAAAAAACSCAMLCGLPLGTLGALIEGAGLLVCNNSAPAHLSAAVGTPLVCLYALTNPQHTPWQASSRVLNHDVPCRNCLQSSCPVDGHPCLRGVGPQRVAQAVFELLALRRGVPNERPTAGTACSARAA